MYYDINFCGNSEWYGLKSIKPVVGGKEIFNKKGLTILKHPDKGLFRRAIEKALVDVVWPDRKGKDKLHHPYTLLNNVNAKLMAKYNVCLLFPFRDILKSSGIERAKIWNRMKYEMGICIKKGVPVIIASMAENEKELVGLHTLRAFGELLGLPPQDAKKALYYPQKKILERENGTNA